MHHIDAKRFIITKYLDFAVRMSNHVVMAKKLT